MCEELLLRLTPPLPNHREILEEHSPAPSKESKYSGSGISYAFFLLAFLFQITQMHPLSTVMEHNHFFFLQKKKISEIKAH